MRAFVLFVALLAVAVFLAAVLTYPVWLLVNTVSAQPFHRVMDRVATLFALIGLVLLSRRLGLSSRAALGYDLPRREFAVQLAAGWLGGLALMVPLATLLLGLHVRVPVAEIQTSVGTLVTQAVISGLAVGLIEETFFRGILFSAVARTSGTTAAILAPSLLYAALHFLGGDPGTQENEGSWLYGFVTLSRLFERYYEPLTFVDSFLALAMLGVLLAWVRLRTGAIAVSIGLHAAGVAAIMVLRATTVVDPQAQYGALVGTYDGVIGWAALSWFAVILVGAVALVRVRERRLPAAGGRP
jgi:uncharacterized protein